MFNPGEVKRLLRRMGININNVGSLEASKVTITLRNGESVEIANPTVIVMELPGGVVLYQIQAEKRNVKSISPVAQAAQQSVIIRPKQEAQAAFSEEDVRLVMEQTGASRDEAIRALEEAKGDIAEAIIRLQEGRKAK